MQPRKIQVLVVEDSPVIQALLAHILEADPELHLLGVAADGAEALALHAQRRPDVILMDIHLPKMDGFEATRRIMETQPVPIVICSATSNPADVATTFRALEAGALAFIGKPTGPHHPDFAQNARNLVQTVKLMSEVKVIRRWHRPARAGAAAPAPSKPELAAPAEVPSVVAMGASTGGPLALEAILKGLPLDFPIPILVVQHIAAGFLPGLASWLSESTGHRVQIAVPDEPLLPGRVLLAPDNLHMGLGKEGRIRLCASEPEHGLRPSVGHLFRSVAQVKGRSVLGVLLTGMGRDGAEELKLLKAGGAITIAQDRESSIVHGMPGEAIRLEAATYVLAPERIAGLMVQLARNGTIHEPTSATVKS